MWRKVNKEFVIRPELRGCTTLVLSVRWYKVPHKDRMDSWGIKGEGRDSKENILSLSNKKKRK